MASLEEELWCSVCCEIFTEPVLLSCSHSFCRNCLKKVWEQNSCKECPLCRRKSSKDFPPLNLVLKQVCEIVKKERHEQRDRQEQTQAKCDLHHEVMSLWCREDEMLVCVQCVSSRKHRGHEFCNLTEALQEKKDKLAAALHPLTEKRESLEKIKRSTNSTATYIKNQAVQTEAQIKQEFEKLHRFLHEEEAARLAKLREEEAEKKQLLEETVEKIEMKLAVLSEIIERIERDMNTDHVAFLQGFDQTQSIVQCTLQDPETVPVPLIDTGKHLNLLKYAVWQKMLDVIQYFPLYLEPLSAHPQLSLSEELTSVSYSVRGKSVPLNPERFDLYVFIVGAPGFDSGSHSWEVEVGTKPNCRIGVARAGVQRKGHFSVCPEEGFYTIVIRKREFRAGTSPEIRLDFKKKPQRIRVSLDFEGGEVTFSDASDGAVIYTFKDTFTEKLYPLFGPSKDSAPLRLCPRMVNVSPTV